MSCCLKVFSLCENYKIKHHNMSIPSWVQRCTKSRKWNFLFVHQGHPFLIGCCSVRCRIFFFTIIYHSCYRCYSWASTRLSCYFSCATILDVATTTVNGISRGDKTVVGEGCARYLSTCVDRCRAAYRM